MRHYIMRISTLMSIMLTVAVAVIGIFIITGPLSHRPVAAASHAQKSEVAQMLPSDRSVDSSSAWAPPPFSQPPAGNADILKLSAAHESDDVIVALIRSTDGFYATEPDDLIALKKAGVSDKVVLAMLKAREDARLPAPVSK